MVFLFTFKEGLSSGGPPDFRRLLRRPVSKTSPERQGQLAPPGKSKRKTRRVDSAGLAGFDFCSRRGSELRLFVSVACCTTGHAFGPIVAGASCREFFGVVAPAEFLQFGL
jgi:hypothetical protein